MKNKAIISLILIAAMVLSATIAFAQSWSQTSGTIGSSYGWQTLQGGFDGAFNVAGVWGSTPNYNNAARPTNTSTAGNYDLTIGFKLQGDLNKTAFVGISTNANSASDQTAWYVIGAPRNGRFMVSSNGGSPRTNTQNQPAYLSSTAATLGSHTAHIWSTNGQTANFSIDNGPAQTLSLSGVPRFVVIHLGNNGSAPSMNSVPAVTSVVFTSENPTTSVTPTPTTNATATPRPVQAALDLQAIREFYASQPVVHMSNQSVVYNPNGTIKQTITGNQTKASPTPVATVPAKTNVTATPTVAATTPLPSTPAVTKTQSPGFEIVLAAIGMIAAMAMITRKKK